MWIHPLFLLDQNNIQNTLNNYEIFCSDMTNRDEPIMCKNKYVAFNILKLKFTDLFYF
jgi:hypothetical protein